MNITSVVGMNYSASKMQVQHNYKFFCLYLFVF